MSLANQNAVNNIVSKFDFSNTDVNDHVAEFLKQMGSFSRRFDFQHRRIA
jgi:3-dehydroquinate dehydratase